VGFQEDHSWKKSRKESKALSSGVAEEQKGQNMFTEEEKVFLDAAGLEQVKEFIHNTFKTKATVSSSIFSPILCCSHSR
jgi:hypothetical protein